MESFRRFLSFFDCYSTPFKVQFHYKTRYQTNFGGIVSFILYILILAAFIYLYVLLHLKEEQNIYTFKSRYDRPPNFKIYQQPEDIKYQKNVPDDIFFLPAFYFTFDGKISTIEEFKKEFSISFEGWNRLNQKKDPKTTLNYTHKECNKTLIEVLNLNNIEHLYCIDATYLEAQGEFIDNIYKYTQIKFSLSKDGPTKTNKDMTNEFQKWKIYFIYTDYSIKTDLKKKSPIVYSTKQLELKFTDGIISTYDFFISFDIFSSQDNLYAHWATTNKQRIGHVNKVDYHVQTHSADDDEYISIFLRSDATYNRYERKFKNFFLFISQIGGLLKVLFVVFGLIVVGTNAMLMNVSISNQMFNMINPDNNSKAFESYEDFKSKEEKLGSTAPIYRSLNPIIKQLSFEYYRFERNRGMEFSLGEALSRVFCFCCDMKKIKEKEKIFDESGEEIERCLDTVSIARFANEINTLSKLLMGQSRIFLKYKERQIVNYNNLSKIKSDSVQHKIYNSATPISLTYYKQKFFVDALITVRNQGDLTNTDLLLIKMMNLNPNLIARFFVSYYDRLKLIYPEMFPKDK